MEKLTNDFVITVGTVNGSGSQSSNNVLVRSLFRMGLPVGGKNLFPSNIQGLPTWFTIRVNHNGFTGRRRLADIVMAMNAQTALADMKELKAGGFFFYNAELKLNEAAFRTDVTAVAIPFREIVTPLSDSVKLRKLLVNMSYVGILGALLEIPEAIIEEVIRHQFGDKTTVIETNIKAIHAGYTFARENLAQLNFPFTAKAIANGNDGKMLIDGNTSAAIGLLYSGCTFVSWYPITPSSSLVENFIDLAKVHRQKDGEANYAVVQAEDELAAISMVLGAGWTGARAMTATSGPGLSLMGEAAGLAYYGEIPSVIWDVQRVGPSTGLPTRTMQGDLLKAYYLSHGDCKHVVLLPSTPEECFEFAQTAFDLAERLQTLVIVLSDLNLGMNFHVAKKFSYPEKPFDRGKVLNKEELEKAKTFARYRDVDGDGIPYRTLPGTDHPLAAYFTRGTGHDHESKYSENPEVYKSNMLRLAKKFETARTLVPKPYVDKTEGARIGLIAFGTTDEAISEARAGLKNQDREASYLRLKALPLAPEVDDFIKSHDRVYLVEQNRDAQLHTLIKTEMPQHWQKCFSVTQFDGLPIEAEEIVQQVIKQEKSL